MASHLSRYQYKDPAQIDMSLAGKVLTLKQEKYDAARAQIQATIDQYVGMQLLKDVDEQYLGARVNEIVNYVNQAGTMDLADGSVAQTLSNYIGSAIDDNVINAINSKKAREQQLAVFEQAKKDDKYHVANATLSEQNWEEYMKDENPGAVYKPQSYIPYFDYNKEVLDNLGKIKDFGDVYVDFQDSGVPMFRYKTTKEVVSPEKAQNIIRQIVGERGLQQLAIEAEYGALNKTKEEVDKEYQDYYKDKISINNSQIKILEELKSGKTDEEVKTIQSRIDTIGEENQKFKKASLKSLSKTQKARLVYTDNYFTNAGQTFSYSKIKDISVDDTEFRFKKFNRETEQWNAEHALRVRQLQLEEAKAKAGANGRVTQNADGTYTPIEGENPYNVFAPTANPEQNEVEQADVVEPMVRHSKNMNDAVAKIVKGTKLKEYEAKRVLEELINKSDLSTMISQYGLSEEQATALVEGNAYYKEIESTAKKTLATVYEMLGEIENRGEGELNDLVGVRDILGGRKLKQLTEEERKKIALNVIYHSKEDFDRNTNIAFDATSHYLMAELGVDQKELAEELYREIDTLHYKPKYSDKWDIRQEIKAKEVTNEFLKENNLSQYKKEGDKLYVKRDTLSGGHRSLGDLHSFWRWGYKAEPALKKASIDVEGQLLLNTVNTKRSAQLGFTYDPKNEKNNPIVTQLNNIALGAISNLRDAGEDANGNKVVSPELEREAPITIYKDWKTGAYNLRFSYKDDGVDGSKSVPHSVAIPQSMMTPELSRYINFEIPSSIYSIDNPNMKIYQTNNVKIFNDTKERDAYIKSQKYTASLNPQSFGATKEELRRALGIKNPEYSVLKPEAIQEIEKLMDQTYSFKVASTNALGVNIHGADGLVLYETNGTGFVKPLPQRTNIDYFKKTSQANGSDFIVMYLQSKVQEIMQDPSNYKQNNNG